MSSDFVGLYGCPKLRRKMQKHFLDAAADATNTHHLPPLEELQNLHSKVWGSWPLAPTDEAPAGFADRVEGEVADALKMTGPEIIADANLHPEMICYLRKNGFSPVLADDIKQKATDLELYQHAVAHGVPIFTHDTDFTDMNTFKLTGSPGIVVIAGAEKDNTSYTPEESALIHAAVWDLQKRVQRKGIESLRGKLIVYDRHPRGGYWYVTTHSLNGTGRRMQRRRYYAPFESAPLHGSVGVHSYRPSPNREGVGSGPSSQSRRSAAKIARLVA